MAWSVCTYCTVQYFLNGINRRWRVKVRFAFPTSATWSFNPSTSSCPSSAPVGDGVASSPSLGKVASPWAALTETLLSMAVVVSWYSASSLMTPSRPPRMSYRSIRSLAIRGTDDQIQMKGFVCQFVQSNCAKSALECQAKAVDSQPPTQRQRQK